MPPPRAALPLPAPGSTSGGGSGARLRSGAGAGAGAGRQLAPVRSGVWRAAVRAGEVAGRALVSRPRGLLDLKSPQAPAKGVAGPWAEEAANPSAPPHRGAPQLPPPAADSLREKSCPVSVPTRSPRTAEREANASRCLASPPLTQVNTQHSCLLRGLLVFHLA